jgi:restriction system protein
MSIWEYLDAVKDPDALRCAAEVRVCPFCSSRLVTLIVPDYIAGMEPPVSKQADVDYTYSASGCEVCGWWRIVRDSDYGYLHGIFHDVDASAGSLKSFDVSDITAPVQEVRNYLAARYEARYEVHPRVFEETVASVFKGLGYGARVTGYSSDGGIDIILDSPTSGIVGVQVKRYRNAIKVESIRSLAGALILNDCTAGVFVTTSEFQSGCEKAAKLFAIRGIPIQLLNASKFYDALRLVERTCRSGERDWLPTLSEHRFFSVDHKETGVRP